jgi:hypothetical protein
VIVQIVNLWFWHRVVLYINILEEPVASICRVEYHSSTLKMEAEGSSEMLVNIYQIIQGVSRL